MGYFTTPVNLHFPQLQTLHIVYGAYQIDKYLDFLNEHNHLRHLHLTISEMSDTKFLFLTANLTNLVEMTVEYGFDMIQGQALSSNVIVEFLRIHDKLNQLNLINFPPHCEFELEAQLKGEWDLRLTDAGLSFKSKTNTRL